MWSASVAKSHHNFMNQAILSVLNPFLRRVWRLVKTVCVEPTGANPIENSSDSVKAILRQERAKAYLRRIVALTAAVRIHDGYQIDISHVSGNMRIRVHDRFVSRLRDVTASRCKWEQTCFYSTNRDLPKEEQIAMVLLQLSNNPALFDKWAVERDVAFKADGQVFTSASSFCRP